MIRYLHRHPWQRAAVLAVLWATLITMGLMIGKAHARECVHWGGPYWHQRSCNVSEGFFGSCPRGYWRRRCLAWSRYYDDDEPYRRFDPRPERTPERVYGWSREDERWTQRDPATERGILCKDTLVRVVGAAHLTKDGAMNEAERHWQSTVRYDYGEKFMSLENARGYRWRCDRASTNESIAGKIGDVLSSGAGFQRRCVIVARPCMMPVERGNSEKE